MGSSQPALLDLYKQRYNYYIQPGAEVKQMDATNACNLTQVNTETVPSWVYTYTKLVVLCQSVQWEDLIQTCGQSCSVYTK